MAIRGIFYLNLILLLTYQTMLSNNQTATYSSNLQSTCQSSTLDEYYTDEDELLTIRNANTWLQQANQMPIPKTLFGKFWHQGELCILFADSNLGKSILGVQIADAISTGKSVEPFDCEAERQPILYCDFELTQKQFEARYSVDYTDHYRFDDYFYRAELNPDSELPPGFKDFDEYLSANLER